MFLSLTSRFVVSIVVVVPCTSKFPWITTLLEKVLLPVKVEPRARLNKASPEAKFAPPVKPLFDAVVI